MRGVVRSGRVEEVYKGQACDREGMRHVVTVRRLEADERSVVEADRDRSVGDVAITVACAIDHGVRDESGPEGSPVQLRRDGSAASKVLGLSLIHL